MEKATPPLSLIEDNDSLASRRPTRQQAEEAVRTLLAYIGDDPNREGLLETPSRVVRAYEELFAGYTRNPKDYLERTFEDAGGYDDLVFVRDIDFQSHCEHHVLPIVGKMHIAYLPHKRVVGLSKLARTMEVFARRLQIQERMTSEIVSAIEETLQPRGVALMVEAEHGCMTCRGVAKKDAHTVTIKLSGAFKDDPQLEQRFFALLEKR